MGAGEPNDRPQNQNQHPGWEFWMLLMLPISLMKNNHSF
jgi:hypothetical protein